MENNNNHSFELWLDEQLDNFYLLPKTLLLAVGNEKLAKIDGQAKYVEPQEIKPYACDKKEALSFLRQEWDNALNAAKVAWLQLHEFANLIKTTEETSKLDFQAMFQDTLAKSGIDLTKVDFKAANIEALFSQNEQNEMVQTIQNTLKKVIGNIAGEIPQNEDDIEEWADNLHQQFFADEIKSKEKRKEKDLKNSVRESIAQRLRENGIMPSIDFDKA